MYVGYREMILQWDFFACVYKKEVCREVDINHSVLPLDMVIPVW